MKYHICLNAVYKQIKDVYHFEIIKVKYDFIG